MNLNKDIIEQFSLPLYIKGKTFAEASEAIEKKFKDREDFTSLDTKEELIKRLSEAQEFIKMQDALKNNAEEVPDMMDGGIPDGMEEFMQNDMGNQMPQEDPMASEMQNPEMQTPEMGQAPNMFAGGGFMNMTEGQNPMGSVEGGLELGNNLFGNTGIDSSGFSDVDSSQVNSFQNTMSGVSSGMKAGSILGPKGQAVGAVVGGISGLIKSSRQKKDAQKGMMKHQHNQAAGMNNNIFEKGGKMYNRGGKVDPPTKHTGNVSTGPITWTKASDSNTSSKNTTSSTFTNKPFEYKDMFNPFKDATGFNSTRPYTPGVNELKSVKDVNMQKLTGEGAEDYTRKSNINKKGNLNEEKSNSENKIMDNIKKYGPDALRLSPVIGNMLTRKNLKRGEDPTRDRLSSRFDRDLFDEKTMVNELDQNNVNRALTEASGGDMGGLRSSILGANLNKDRARSSAMVKGQNINRNQNQIAQQFNLGVDSTNLQQSNLDVADSMVNEGAYQTAKQNLNAAIATDLGRIGKELQDRGMAEKMFGYTSKGDYVVNDKGEKLSHEEYAKELGVDFKNGKYVINGKELSPEEFDKAKKSLFKDGGMGKSLDASNELGVIA